MLIASSHDCSNKKKVAETTKSLVIRKFNKCILIYDFFEIANEKTKFSRRKRMEMREKKWDSDCESIQIISGTLNVSTGEHEEKKNGCITTIQEMR